MILRWTGRPPAPAAPPEDVSVAAASRPVASGRSGSISSSRSASRVLSLQQELSLLPASTRRLPSEGE